MEISGDFHNFGKQVKQDSNDAAWFFKPRPVFWEWLYFGKDSPLKPIMHGLASHCGHETGFDWFNLEFRGDVRHSEGFSKKIIPKESTSLNVEHDFIEFGALLAYCFVLGIQDLHEGNLIRTKHGLQVIDVEVVGSKLELPHETLLLPFKQIGTAECGLAHLFTGDLIPEKTSSALLDGFIRALDFITKNRSLIAECIENEIKKAPRTPVRVIIRDTFRYHRHTTFEPPLMPAETVQMERGDVPYFFKFYEDAALYYYTSANGQKEETPVFGTLAINPTRTATRPSDLLSERRLINLAPPAILFLLRYLIDKDSSYHRVVSNMELTADDKHVSVKTQGQLFKANRNRKL